MTARRHLAAWTTAVLTLFAGAARAEEPPKAKPAEQTWAGTLVVQPGLELKLVLHIHQDAKGALTATMDSPDQGANGLAVDSVTYEKGEATLTSKVMAAKFVARPSADGKTLEGTFTQGGKDFVDWQAGV